MVTHIVIPGQCDFGGFYTETVARFPSGSHFVEVGSYFGQSALAMAMSIENSGKAIRFDCVDTWDARGTPQAELDGQRQKLSYEIDGQDELYFRFLKNMFQTGAIKYITPIKLPSLLAVNLYGDVSLDFVFIDASHDYDSVKADIKVWLPKIKDGGLLAGHDYGSPGVSRAVNEAFNIESGLGNKGNVWTANVKKVN